MIRAQIPLAGSASQEKAQYFLIRMQNKFHYIGVFPFTLGAFIKNNGRKKNIFFDYVCIYAVWIDTNSPWSLQSNPSVHGLQQLLKTLIWIHLFFRLDCSTHHHCPPFSCYNSFQVRPHIKLRFIYCIGIITKPLLRQWLLCTSFKQKPILKCIPEFNEYQKLIVSFWIKFRVLRWHLCWV